VQPAAQWPVEEASPSGIAIVDDVVLLAALRGNGSGGSRSGEPAAGDDRILRVALR
jgi:hypothetical protein